MLERGRCTIKFSATHGYDEKFLTDRVKRAGLLAIFPIEILKLDRVSTLSKCFSGGPHLQTLPRAVLSDLLAGTPFCLTVGDLAEQSLCAFVNESHADDNYQAITSWLSGITQQSGNIGITTKTSASQVLLCKKGHMIKISVPAIGT
jgi:hypothetical protein